MNVIKLIFVSLLLLCVSAVTYPEEKELVVICDHWPPWQFGTEGEEPSGGKAYVIVREILRRSGYKASVTLYPWSRCMEMIKRGEADILFIASKNMERSEYMIFSEPLFKDPYLLYSLSERNIQWTNWIDLKRYKIGITRGFNYGDNFNTAAKKYFYSTIESEKCEINVANVMAGRLDAAILNEEFYLDYIKKNPDLKNRFVSAQKPINVPSYYLVFPKVKKDTELIRNINREITMLRSDGFIKKVLASEQ